MNVTAKIERDGPWWIIEVPEVPGALPQVSRLDKAAEQAAWAVADLLEIDPATIQVTLDMRLNPDLKQKVAHCRELATHLEQL